MWIILIIPLVLPARWTLPLTDVLAVRYGDDWIPGVNVKEKQPTSPTTVCPTNFILHYAVRGPKNKWRHHSVTMSHTDPRQVASWVKTIRNYLLGEASIIHRRSKSTGAFRSKARENDRRVIILELRHIYIYTYTREEACRRSLSVNYGNEVSVEIK